MDRQSTCFFTGHRQIPDERYDTIYQKTVALINKLAIDGYTDFICGGAIGYDTLAANAVLSLREVLGIRLHLILPCADQHIYFSKEQKEEYRRIMDQSDSVNILSQSYYRGCMHARNRKMADLSSACVAFCERQSGGTAYTVSYAERKGISVFFVK